MTFAAALPVVLAFEGGKADNPHDRGGRTAYGITQSTYDAWRGSATPSDVWRISLEEVEAIYRHRYWDAVNGDGISAESDRLAVVVFDSAVNHGVGVAARMLQRTVQATPDGIVGPLTLAALRRQLALTSESVVLTAYLGRRLALYRSILHQSPSQDVFRKGWRKRLNHLAAHVGVPAIWEDDV